MSQTNILSSETDYTPLSFFPNGKDLNVSKHIQTLKVKSYLNLESEVPQKQLETPPPPKRTSLFILDPLSSDRRRKSDLQKFPNEAVQSRESPREENFKEGQFSLAKQNEDIQRKLKEETGKGEKQIGLALLQSLDKNEKTDFYNGFESPKSRGQSQIANFEMQKKEDTPIVQKSQKSSSMLETPNQNKMDFSNKKNSLNQEKQSIKSETRQKIKKNDLKRRLKLKQELKRQKQAKQQSEKVSKSLENLSLLLVHLNSNEEKKADYSQLDLNLMKTLSKSVHKSNLLKTQSRYEFVDPECSSETNSEILSIMGLIKAFLSPSQQPLRGRQTLPKSQSNKVKICL